MPSCFVYILECKDKTYYTGITQNLERRIEEHNKGIGAKYTRGRRPVVLRFSEKFPNRRKAVKRELEIKRMSRKEKIELINSNCS